MLQGTAAGGGSVGLTVSGVFISVNTTAGQTGAQVIFALVIAINADPTLIGLGVSALAEGDTLLADAPITATSIDDTGLARPVPLFAWWQLLLLAAVLAESLRRWR